VGIENILIKPVNASVLFDISMRVLEKHNSQEKDNHANASSQHLSQTLPKEVDLNVWQALRGTAVLLVEDNELNQEVAIDLLTDMGLNVEVANNGQEALHKLSQRSYQAVLMDMQMPIMDGLTATRHIRSHQQFDSLPIIAMTANAMPQDREKCFAVGMNDFVTKPIDPPQLLTALLKWIEPQNTSERPVAQKHTSIFQRDETEDILLPSIEGLDYEQGLKPVLGHRKNYLKMLKRYLENQKNVPTQIDQALKEDDYLEAGRLAHSAKGTSGNIGAISLQKIAGDLEQLIFDKKDLIIIQTKWFEFEQTHSAIMSAIAKLVKNADALQNEISLEMPQDKQIEILHNFESMLNAYDGEAIEFFEDHILVFKSALNEAEFKKIELFMKQLDFESALKLIKRAQN
jgi:two-component system sensor histidine kinase/response regulator